MHHFFRLLWKWTVLLLAGVVILLALGIGLFRLIVPQAPAYRAQVEQLAEELIGFPVAIESLSLEWDWLGPELILHDVRLLGPQARVVLVSADEVQVMINLTDFFARPLQPTRVTLIHPVAEMARDAQGNLMFSGIVLNGAGEQHELRGWRNTLETLLTYTTTEIKNGELYWRTRSDLHAAGVPARWLFSPVNLHLESDNETYTLQGEIGLPASLGQRLSLQVTAVGPADAPASWAWDGMLNGEELQAQLIYWVLDVTDAQLMGSLSIHLKGEGVGLQPGLLHGSVHMENLARVVPQLAANTVKHAAVFQTIHSAFSWEVSPADPLLPDSTPLTNFPWPAHWELNLQGLFVQRGNQSWPISRWRITRTQLGADTSRWQAAIDFVRLNDVTELLTWLPPDLFAAQETLIALEPRGDINNLQFLLQREKTEVAYYAGQASFKNLGWSPLKTGFPDFGLHGLDGRLGLSSAGGRLKLATQSAQAQFPALFRTPLTVDFINGTAFWQQKKTGWLVVAPNTTLGNQDVAKVRAKLRAWLPKNRQESSWLNLTAEYRDINFANKSRYLPVGIMPDNLVEWLDTAVISGHSPAGELVLRGSLDNFPWPNKHGPNKKEPHTTNQNTDGLFRVTGELRDMVLAFHPQWPRLEAINGRVLFEGLRFQAWADNVVTNGITIEKAQAGMVDMTGGLLTAQAQAALPIQQGMDYLRATPLAENFTAYFKHVALQGEANTAVDLQLPLSHLADSQVNVATVLRSTQAKVTGIPAPFKSIAGKLIITEQGLSSPGFTGQWLGKPFTGKIINKDATRIYVSGQSAVDDLARVFNWPLDYLTGGTAWQAEVAVLPKTDTPLQLHIATQLKGVAVNLPAPFGKSKEAVSPLQVDLAIVDSRHARLDVYYAEAAARLVGRSPADTWQLDAGKLILGSGNDTKAFNDLPASGLAVNGALAQLDLEKWLSALELQPSPAQSSSVEAIPVDTRRYDSSDWPPAWLQSVDISIGLLKAFAQQIPDLQLTYRRQPGDAIIKLQSQPLAGSIVLPLQGDLPFRIDLARAWLTLPSGPEAEPTEAKSADSLKPTQIPAMAIRVQDLRIEDAMVGAVELSLKPIAAGLALEGLTIEGPEYTLNAQGSWTQSAQEQRTALTVEAHSTSVAETLRALGFAAAVTADSGSITSQVNWPGSPFGEILAVLDGRLHLRLEDGALREVEPGAGRLFGLLSLSALPRRLLLDFSDFFSEGLSFDTITGDFILVDGNAYTSNLTLVSPAADILVVGRIGLGAQDFDQLAIVNAHVSSALPVAGALAAGPQAGAIMLLLTQLLDEPLEKASRRKYHITGPWENPQVVPVDDEARDTP